MTEGRGRIVMIVDDDSDIREAIAEVLEDVGYRTVGAENGVEALLALRTRPEKPAVILLDVMMPIMDAKQFRDVQLADAELMSIPVVVLTAHANAEETAAELRAAGYLRKPARLAALMAAIAPFTGA